MDSEDGIIKFIPEGEYLSLNDIEIELNELIDDLPEIVDEDLNSNLTLLTEL